MSFPSFWGEWVILSQREIQDKSKYLICFLKGISIIDDGKPLILDGSKPKYSKLPGNSELSTNVQVHGSAGKESACSAGDTGDAGSIHGSRRSLEKETATRSSIPAWEIPWTEESGGLHSMGLQRVGHDWVAKGISNQVHEMKKTIKNEMKSSALS